MTFYKYSFIIFTLVLLNVKIYAQPVKSSNILDDLYIRLDNVKQKIEDLSNDKPIMLKYSNSPHADEKRHEERESAIAELLQIQHTINKYYPYMSIADLQTANSIYAAYKAQLACSSDANWTAIGPFGVPSKSNALTILKYHNGNGRIISIFFDHLNSNIVYYGSESGALWKQNQSLNTSSSMNLEFTALAKGVSTGAVVYTSTSQRRVVVATGSHMPADASAHGMCDGIWYSNNDGVSWTKSTIYVSPAGTPGNTPSSEFSYSIYNYDQGDAPRIVRIVYHPSAPDVVWAISRRRYEYLTPLTRGQLLKSTDGGVNWYPVENAVLADRYFNDIEIHPNNPQIMYLASKKLYKTTDGGSTWTDVTGFLTNLGTTTNKLNLTSGDVRNDQNYFISVAVPPMGVAAADENKVSALAYGLKVSANSQAWYYASSNGFGSAVSPVNMSGTGYPPVGGGGYLQFAIAGNVSTLLFASQTGWRSTNGTSFTEYLYSDKFHPDIRAVATPPVSFGTNKFYLGTDGGAFLSTDNGLNFTYQGLNITATQFYDVSVSQTNNSGSSTRLYGSTLDNSTLRQNGDGSWSWLYGGDGDRVFASPIPGDENYMYYSDIQDNSDIKVSWTNGSMPSYSYTYANLTGAFAVQYTPKPIVEKVGSDKAIVATNWLYELPKQSQLPTPPAGSASAPTATYVNVNPIAGSAVAAIYGQPYSTNDYFREVATHPTTPGYMVCITSGHWKDGAGNIGNYSPSAAWSDPNGSQINELIKTTDGGQTWTNITPDHATSPGFPTGIRGRMSSVTISSRNPDDIWITYYGFQSLSNACGGNPCNVNVFHSADGGITWNEYSDGLPKVPTSKVVYRNFSEDELYLATDVGVFYRNAYMSQWECFSDGLPNSEIRDIEIDYCEQKLIAATYGQGMWSTPLAAHSESYIYNDYTIPAGVTTFASNTIRVINGATLTIRGLLGMPAGTKILVDEGATLVLDGGTLTNTCGQMWDGIEVAGYNTAAHPAITVANYATTAHASHGLVVLKKDGTRVPRIEHALAGVTANNGGIVLAEDALIHNNHHGFVFNAFRPSVSGGGCSGFANCDNNVSSLKRCTLEVTDAARFTGNVLRPFVMVSGTYGVDISESIFRNTSTQPGLFPDDYRGTGVYVLDGSVNLLGTSTAYNQFSTLTRGVDVNFTSLATFASQYMTTVDYNRFTDIRQVALIATGGTNRVSFTRNTLTLPSSSTIVNPYGIYLNGSLRPVVDENTLTGGMPGLTGLYVKNCGGSTSWKVYRNTFSNIPADAVILDGTNQNVQVSCNTFTNIFGYNVKAFNSVSGTVAISNQGSSGLSAGNLINDSNGSCTTANSLDHIWVSTTNSSMNYYYSGATAGTNPLYPTCYSSVAVPLNTTNANACPSSWSGGGGTGKTAENSRQAAWENALSGPEADREWWMGEYLRLTGDQVTAMVSAHPDPAIALLREHPTAFSQWQEPALLMEAGRVDEAQKQVDARLAQATDPEVVAMLSWLKWQMQNAQATPDAKWLTELQNFENQNFGNASNAQALAASIRGGFAEPVYRAMPDDNNAGIKPMSLMAHPNPTADRTTLNWNLNGEDAVSLTVFDPAGKTIMVLHPDARSLTAEVDLSELPQGIYLVQIRTASDTVLSTRISNLR